MQLNRLSGTLWGITNSLGMSVPVGGSEGWSKYTARSGVYRVEKKGRGLSPVHPLNVYTEVGIQSKK